MVLKIFKGMWFLSMLAVLANLLYVYAGLPEKVIIQEESTGRVLANREFLFYALTGLLLIVNLLVYLAAHVYRENEDFRSWLHGQTISINLFFILSLNFIQVYNSSERFDFSRVGPIIYGSVVLVVLWAASWPVYLVYRKFFPKQVVL
jgi:hypothetical protein